MSPRKNVYPNSFHFSSIKIANVEGLSKFKSTIEREYFCKAKITSYITDEDKVINLIIELDFNFEFLEIISTMSSFDFNKNKDSQTVNFRLTAFNKALGELRRKNKNTIDIEELNIYMNECSYIIHKLYPQSIPEQIESILDKIISHHTYFPMLFKEIPYEVFIPVFEESQLEDAKSDLAEKEDYFKFWGLYFEHEPDAVIYEVAEKEVIKSDLSLLR